MCIVEYLLGRFYLLDTHYTRLVLYVFPFLKALYKASQRHPIVAFIFKTFRGVTTDTRLAFIFKTFRGIATDTRLACLLFSFGIPRTVLPPGSHLAPGLFGLKPFAWHHEDTQLWHSFIFSLGFFKDSSTA